MSSPGKHYLEAERLLRQAAGGGHRAPDILAAAQVHASLAACPESTAERAEAIAANRRSRVTFEGETDES